jgi:hypothetical protein
VRSGKLGIDPLPLKSPWRVSTSSSEG